jgi:hypothetical protein
MSAALTTAQSSCYYSEIKRLFSKHKIYIFLNTVNLYRFTNIYCIFNKLRAYFKIIHFHFGYRLVIYVAKCIIQAFSPVKFQSDHPPLVRRHLVSFFLFRTPVYLSALSIRNGILIKKWTLFFFWNRFPRRGVLTEAPRCLILYQINNCVTQTESATKRAPSTNRAVAWIFHNTCSDYTNQTQAKSQDPRTKLFRVMTQQVMAIYYSRFGTTYRSHLQLLFNSWTVKIGPIGCPETSVINYQYSSRNNP